jgi:hypothetical protein
VKTKAKLGTKDPGFVNEAVKFIRKEVVAVEDKLHEEAKSIAITSSIFGASIGILLGIVGTVLFQKYVTPPIPPMPPNQAVLPLSR